jgi:hypothetical protein
VTTTNDIRAGLIATYMHGFEEGAKGGVHVYRYPSAADTGETLARAQTDLTSRFGAFASGYKAGLDARVAAADLATDYADATMAQAAKAVGS